MGRIFHITTEEAWAKAQADGVYAADSLAGEGFIHCSDEHQVVEVGQRLFKGRSGLVLLHVDADRLGVEVRRENLEGGTERYPHVYGAIPLGAVVRVTPFTVG